MRRRIPPRSFETERSKNVSSHLYEVFSKEFKTTRINSTEFGIIAEYTVEHEYPVMLLRDLSKQTSYTIRVNHTNNEVISINVICEATNFCSKKNFNANEDVNVVASQMISFIDKIIKNLIRRTDRSVMSAKVLEWAISKTEIQYDDAICIGKKSEVHYKRNGQTIMSIVFGGEDVIYVEVFGTTIADMDRKFSLAISNPNLPVELARVVDENIKISKAAHYVADLAYRAAKSTSPAKFEKLKKIFNDIYEIMQHHQDM